MVERIVARGSAQAFGPRVVSGGFVEAPVLQVAVGYAVAGIGLNGGIFPPVGLQEAQEVARGHGIVLPVEGYVAQVVVGQGKGLSVFVGRGGEVVGKAPGGLRHLPQAVEGLSLPIQGIAKDALGPAAQA